MADIIERLREHAEIHESHIPHDDEQRGWADDLRKAADEIARLRARVAELEAARGEPVAWVLKTGHGTAFATVKPECEVDLWVPLYTAPPADEIDRLRDKARLYEELRAVVDGGSESMTHADAIREIRWLQDFAEGESEA